MVISIAKEGVYMWQNNPHFCSIGWTISVWKKGNGDYIYRKEIVIIYTETYIMQVWPL